MQCEQDIQSTCEFGVLSCVCLLCVLCIWHVAHLAWSRLFLLHMQCTAHNNKKIRSHTKCTTQAGHYQRHESFRISKVFHEIHPGGIINSLNESWCSHQWNCVTSYKTPFLLVLTLYLGESHDSVHRCVNDLRPTALLSDWYTWCNVLYLLVTKPPILRESERGSRPIGARQTWRLCNDIDVDHWSTHVFSTPRCQ